MISQRSHWIGFEKLLLSHVTSVPLAQKSSTFSKAQKFIKAIVVKDCSQEQGEKYTVLCI